MHPHFAANLAATLSRPPWRKELDWGLHTTMEWEKRIPFSSYIQPGDAAAPSIPGQVFSFPQFCTLPLEIQYRILAFCPAHTLFQVMRVSSILRKEASKLFWADSDAYFYVEGYWLLDGGYPGDICWDLGFLENVRNVEIWFNIGTISAIRPLRDTDETVTIRQQQITSFWRSFKQRFPSARQVLITYLDRPPEQYNDIEPVTEPLRALVQACPLHIKAYAFVLKEQCTPPPTGTSVTTDPSTRIRWQRSVYQPSAADSTVWLNVELNRHRKTVLVPMKRCHGPVGEFKRIYYAMDKIWLQKSALWPLMIEAVARRHFTGGESDYYSCPSTTCEIYFTEAEEWIVHAADSHAQHWREFDILPSETRVLFEERERALEAISEESNAQIRMIMNEWHEDEGKNQEVIEHAWMEQLDNDKAWETGKSATESMLWEEFLHHMDPDWEI